MTQKMYYRVVFKVTETCQNGKERWFKKTLLAEPFKDGKHQTEDALVEKGIAILKEMHYYNIEYVGTWSSTLTFMD